VKHRWLYLLLVLSLAVNAGVLGFYGLEKYRDWRIDQQSMARIFKPGTTRRQVWGALADFEKARAPWYDTMSAATKELGFLAEEPNPDSVRVSNVLDRIARSHREVSRLLHEFERGTTRLLRQDQFELERKMERAYLDSMLMAESSGVTKDGGAR